MKVEMGCDGEGYGGGGGDGGELYGLINALATCIVPGVGGNGVINCH